MKQKPEITAEVLNRIMRLSHAITTDVVGINAKQLAGNMSHQDLVHEIMLIHKTAQRLMSEAYGLTLGIKGE